MSRHTRALDPEQALEVIRKGRDVWVALSSIERSGAVLVTAGDWRIWKAGPHTTRDADSMEQGP